MTETTTQPQEQPLASLRARFGALLLDSFLLSLFGGTFYLMYVLPRLSTEEGVKQIVEFQWLYNIIFIMLLPALYEGIFLQWRGQTLGKMFFKIKVVKRDGNPMSALQAWGRTIVRVGFLYLGTLARYHILLSVLGMINYLPAGYSKEKKAIHDTLCRTFVVNCQATDDSPAEEA